jgi:hypothetical protein
MAEMIIFSAPKPFTNPHIAVIQRNAIRSWRALGPDVRVVLVGEEEGLAEAARQEGVLHLPNVARNPQGTPLVSSIFSLARQSGAAALLAYVNADVLLLPDFLSGARQVHAALPEFLIVGRRWDLSVREPLDFSAAAGTRWDERLETLRREKGRLHPPGGSDYFIFPHNCFQQVPDFAIGRAGWDNWMIYEARRRGWGVVDASEDIRVIHQDHDYSHLPGGQPHYRLPETTENIRLAGGRQAIFVLPDASLRLAGGRLERLPLTWKRFWREVEIFPQVRLGWPALGNVFWALFHPKKSYWAARSWLSQRLSRRLRQQKPPVTPKSE